MTKGSEAQLARMREYRREEHQRIMQQGHRLLGAYPHLIFVKTDPRGHRASNKHYQVFDIGKDGGPRKRKG